MIGVLAALAIPKYTEYTARGGLAQAVGVGRQATTAFTNFYQAKKTVPRTLTQAGFTLPPNTPGVQDIKVDSDGTIVLTVAVAGHAGKSILFVPSLDAKKRIVWACGSREINRTLLPQDCQD
jgi:type II secretory pathway pseudopilin PulG